MCGALFGIWFRTVRHTYTNKDSIKYAATLPNYPCWCILIDYFNKVTLARSNSALPDDGDYIGK